MCPLWASSECVSYKINPKITIKTPDWVKEVVQPLEAMDLWHGNVIATMIDKYDIITDVKDVNNGFCVILKAVDSIFGYNNFRVNIDIRHTPNTCEYNTILKHEEKHIKTYLDVINDFNSELKQSIFNAADSIMPVFVKTKQDINDAILLMNNELQNHPDLILIKQKIKAAEEIRNKNIDKKNNYDELKKCFY